MIYRTCLMLLAGFTTLLLASRCGPMVPPPVDPNPPPAPTVDGGEEPLPPEPNLTACGRACARMRRLKCPGHEGSPQGATCEQVCDNMERSGVASFCADEVAQIQGKLGIDGERICDERELQAAFEACE